MVCFQNPNLGKYCREIWKRLYDIFYGRLKYFMDIWDILWPFDTFCVHLVHFSGFGIMHRDKSGNPAAEGSRRLRRLCRCCSRRSSGPSLASCSPAINPFQQSPSAAIYEQNLVRVEEGRTENFTPRGLLQP
jgi:hypothetical protein